MVAWKKIKDICSNICSGGTPNTKKREYYYGDIPWLRTQEVDWGNIYDTEIKISQKGIDNSSAKIIEKDCVIVAMYGATAAKVAINKIPLSTNQACCNLKINKDISCYRYVYFWLCKEYHKLKALGEGSQNNISGQKIKDYPIPVPSLEEQKRIVGILDTFTDSIENLKQQIAQRRKQYEHYRDELLDLEGKDGVEMKALGDVLISLKTGLNPRKNFVLNSPNSNNYYITVRELGLFDIKPTDKTDKVTDEALQLINNRSNLEAGDVLFSGTGTIGRTALVTEHPHNWNIKEGVYTLKPRKNLIISRFLIELLHSNIIIKKVDSLVVGDPIRSIPMKSLVLISIPLPSLSEQQRIVSILDTFEASISNLEAQLAQRQKQYEYYRNQLLTFE